MFPSSSRLFELMLVGAQQLRQTARAIAGDTRNRRLLAIVLLGLFGAASESNAERFCDAVCSGYERCRGSFVSVSKGVSTCNIQSKSEHFIETTF